MPLIDGRRPTMLLIDAHVHIHEGVDPYAAIVGAHARMVRRAGEDVQPVFLLAEQQGRHMHDALRLQAMPSGEPESLWVGARRRALVVAGRQIVTREKLEILALATTADLPDGLPSEEVLERLGETDALVVLPWGVGKWIGRRGRLVERLLAQDRDGRLMLGDIGGRPGFWPVRGFRTRTVLRGSDPLPIPGGAGRIGGYGFFLNAALSPDRPARDLRAALRSMADAAAPYGKTASPFRFFNEQFRLRLAT
ncbi:MAG: hypothetical protein QM690_08290 [Sphingobium sp.]